MIGVLTAFLNVFALLASVFGISAAMGCGLVYGGALGLRWFSRFKININVPPRHRP